MVKQKTFKNGIRLIVDERKKKWTSLNIAILCGSKPRDTHGYCYSTGIIRTILGDVNIDNILIKKRIISIDERIKEIESVTIDDVKKFAQKIARQKMFWLPQLAQT